MRRFLLALVVPLAFASACGSSGPEGIEALRAANERRTISAVGKELLELLDKGRASTFHATYAVRTDDPQMSAGSFIVEIWRKAPMVRQDTTNNLQSGTARSSEILGADGVRVHCEKLGNDPWSCSKVSSTVRDGFDDLVGQAKDQLEGAIVTVSSERVSGRTARCFHIRRLEEGTTTACVTAEGVVTKIVADGTGLELTNLQMNANDKDFVPPALPVD